MRALLRTEPKVRQVRPGQAHRPVLLRFPQPRPSQAPRPSRAAAVPRESAAERAYLNQRPGILLPGKLRHLMVRWAQREQGVHPHQHREHWGEQHSMPRRKEAGYRPCEW